MFVALRRVLADPFCVWEATAAALLQPGERLRP